MWKNDKSEAPLQLALSDDAWISTKKMHAEHESGDSLS